MEEDESLKEIPLIRSIPSNHIQIPLQSQFHGMDRNSNQSSIFSSVFSHNSSLFSSNISNDRPSEEDDGISSSMIRIRSAAVIRDHTQIAFKGFVNLIKREISEESAALIEEFFVKSEAMKTTELDRVKLMLKVLKNGALKCNCDQPRPKVCLNLIFGAFVSVKFSEFAIKYLKTSQDFQLTEKVVELISRYETFLVLSDYQIYCAKIDEEKLKMINSSLEIEGSRYILKDVSKYLLDRNIFISINILNSFLKALSGTYIENNKRPEEIVFDPITTSNEPFILSQRIYSPYLYKEIVYLSARSNESGLVHGLKHLNALLSLQADNICEVLEQPFWFEWVVPMLLVSSSQLPIQDKLASAPVESSMAFKLQVNSLSLILSEALRFQRDYESLRNNFESLYQRINSSRASAGDEIFRVLLFSLLKRLQAVKSADFFKESNYTYQNQFILFDIILNFSLYSMFVYPSNVFEIKLHMSSELDLPDRILLQEVVFFFRDKMTSLRKIFEESMVFSSQSSGQLTSAEIKKRIAKMEKTCDVFEDAYAFLLEVKEAKSRSKAEVYANRLANYLQHYGNQNQTKAAYFFDYIRKPKEEIANSLLSWFDKYVEETIDKGRNSTAFEVEQIRSFSIANAQEFIAQRLANSHLSPRIVKENASQTSAIGSFKKSKSLFLSKMENLLNPDPIKARPNPNLEEKERAPISSPIQKRLKNLKIFSKSKIASDTPSNSENISARTAESSFSSKSDNSKEVGPSTTISED
jgi:hypothetical protein